MPDRDAVPVALLYPNDAAGAHLREALARCGTPIVYETLTGSADRDALEQSGARVVVVNLDAEVDSYLDDMQRLLAGCDCRIVFNDGQVSSGLSGWDEARWMRHLAAKIRGQDDASPPRPADAAPVPGRADGVHPAHAVLWRGDETDGTSAPGSGVAGTLPGDGDEVPGQPVLESGATLGGAMLAPGDLAASPGEPLIVPQIETREVEASDMPDFSGWSIEELDDGPSKPPVVAVDAADFGVELVDAVDFLAPPPATPAVVAAVVHDELSLVPLEDEPRARAATPDHENWFNVAAIEAGLHIRLQRVWVLAAATGGPQPVRDALARLPADYPAMFLLAQQMGEDFIDVMLDQLAGSTALRVRRAVAGERATRGDVLIVPAGQSVSLDRTGMIAIHDGAPAPLDRLLRDVVATFGARAGAIVFSGVSVELLDALRDMRGKGAEVWVQDPQTCLIGALAEAAAEADLATFVGTPEALAERLLAQAGESVPSLR